MVAALLTAVLLLILSNLANDLGDHEHGTDNDQRVGPERAVQSGAITPAAMKRAMMLCGVLAFASGLWLIFTAFGFTFTTLVFLLIGLAANVIEASTDGASAWNIVAIVCFAVMLFAGFEMIAKAPPATD